MSTISCYTPLITSQTHNKATYIALPCYTDTLKRHVITHHPLPSYNKRKKSQPHFYDNKGYNPPLYGTPVTHTPSPLPSTVHWHAPHLHHSLLSDMHTTVLSHKMPPITTIYKHSASTNTMLPQSTLLCQYKHLILHLQNIQRHVPYCIIIQVHAIITTNIQYNLHDK
jgi:hypothetical protein